MGNKYDLTVEEMRELAKIEALLEKHALEIDSETEEILQYIVKGHVVSGVEKLLTKTWAINKLIQMWGDYSVGPMIRQKAFEFLCDLLGHTPQSSKHTQNIMDVVIGDK